MRIFNRKVHKRIDLWCEDLMKMSEMLEELMIRVDKLETVNEPNEITKACKGLMTDLKMKNLREFKAGNAPIKAEYEEGYKLYVGRDK